MARKLKKPTNKPATVVRVIKFEIFPTSEQLSSLTRVSDNLWMVWNEKLLERQEYFNSCLKPLYEKIKIEGKTQELQQAIKDAFDNAPVNYIPGSPQRSQRSWLTTMRQSRADFEAVPCAWQQETLVILEGAYDSFAKLRKNGDTTARPPREKAADSFCEVQGLGSFYIRTDTINVKPQTELSLAVHGQAILGSKEVSIVLSPGKVLYNGPELSFPIPAYQKQKLARVVKIAKFTLYRESRRGKSHRYWISLADSIIKPETTLVEDEDLVFIAIGASYLGVATKHGEKVIDLWRPDKHWLPKIEAVKERLKKTKKDSKAYHRRYRAMVRMQQLRARQTLKNHREVIAGELRKLGTHFVILEHSPVRGKKGALADSTKTERGGTLGANWSAQNSGSLAQLKQLLGQKVEEWGGSVRTEKLAIFPHWALGVERKLAAARALREQVLA